MNLSLSTIFNPQKMETYVKRTSTEVEEEQTLEIEALARDITEISEMMTTIQQMCHEQSAKVDQIGSLTSESAHHTAIATNELRKASKSYRSYIRRVAACIGTGIVVVSGIVISIVR